jgi:hypothetical protein
LNMNVTAIVVKASHPTATTVPSAQTSGLGLEADHLPQSSDDVNK